MNDLLSKLLPQTPANTVTNPVSLTDKENRLAVRKQIDTYENALKDLFGSDRGDMDEINCDGLKEYFVGGAYIRELFIPAGVTIVSKLWKKERFWIIAEGDVTFTTETGINHVQAPYFAQAPYGSKVALYANTDTRWFAITGAESTNSKDVDDELVANDYTECIYPWDKLEDKKL